jgi:hypothetical protein
VSAVTNGGDEERLAEQAGGWGAGGLDDEELLAALREAVRARRAVPEGFVEAGKRAFAWHSIDAELAQLTYDSTHSRDLSALTRAESAPIRALTFTSTRARIELEVVESSLLGQILPAQPATIEVQARDDAEQALAADETGCFSVHPIPRGPFRLRCRLTAGSDILTGWVTL